MLRRYLFLLFLVVMVAACSNGDDLAALPGGAETALVNDADLDAARFLGEAEVRALDLSALDLQGVANRSSGFQAGLVAQTQTQVPLDVASQLAYIQERQGNTRIVLRETLDEGRGGYRQVLVYNSAREATSVAVSGDGQLLVFAAENRQGNVEVYLFDRDGSRLGQRELVRLTDTAADESNVSMSLDGSVIAWETELDGAATFALATLEPRLSVITYDFGGISVFDPSLSGDGATLVFVGEGDDLDAPADLLFIFPLAGEPTGVYLGDVRDPSLSFTGDTLLFAEGSYVSYVDLVAGVLTDLLQTSGVEHPFLTSDGLYFSYVKNGEVLTRLVDTEAPATAPEDVVDARFSNSEAYWAKLGYELSYSGSTLDGPTFVRPDDGGGLTDAERTVAYHRYSFKAPISDRYQVLSEQNYDGYLLLYEGNFNPRKPTQNLLAFNDDYGGAFSPANDPPGTSRVTAELEAGQRYTVVTTSYDASSAGLFTNVITRNVPPPPPPFVLPEPDDSGYDITLRFATDNLTEEQQATFEAAAARWSNIITGDLTDLEDFALPEDFFFTNTGPVEGTLDDLLIDVAFSDLDGPSGLLGRAGPLLIRQGTDDDPLTIYGIMEFDINEFAEGGFFQDEQAYEDTVVHEMGHVIGIGTLWELTGNTEGIETDPITVPPGLPNPDYDPRFTGPGAVAEYQALLSEAGQPEENSVPIANDGGPGNYNGHWREIVFGNELMTPYAGGMELLSKMTAASLGDLGYTVDVASGAINADYVLPPPYVPGEFRQTAPATVEYEEGADFIVASGSPQISDVAGAVVNVDLNLSDVPNSTSGCEAADFSDLTDQIALIRRGTCDFETKVNNAVDANAAGVIIMNQGDAPDRTGLMDPALGTAADKIPVVFVTYDLGVELANTNGLEVEVYKAPPEMNLETLRVGGAAPEFDEQLIRPIGTVSPDGTITYLE